MTVKQLELAILPHKQTQQLRCPPHVTPKCQFGTTPIADNSWIFPNSSEAASHPSTSPYTPAPMNQFFVFFCSLLKDGMLGHGILQNAQHLVLRGPCSSSVTVRRQLSRPGPLW